jgi:hypothetical protein
MAKNQDKKDKQSKKEQPFPGRNQSVTGLGSINQNPGKGERPKAL